jgi:hypothetical protein
MASRLRAFAASATMALVALVVAHNLIYLVEYGQDFTAALSRTGHDGTWSRAVALVLLAGLVGALAANFQLQRLSRRAAAVGTESLGERLGRRFVIRWLALGSRLLVVTTVLFAVQENLEHLQAGLALPGLGAVLPPDQLLALPVIAVVALTVALIGALFGWRIEVLQARLRAARNVPRLAPARPPHPISSDQPRPGRRLGPGVAGRAPPRAIPV